VTEPLATGRTRVAARVVAGADISVIAKDMERVEGVLAGAAASQAHPLVSDAALHLIRAGGKRIRPALVLLSARVGDPGFRATDLAAAAIELVHIATLYHDDVIDETERRRGVPTAHSKWGIEVAVLAGDYLFARGCALGAQAGGEVPGILAEAIGLVCEGQIMETAALHDADRSVDNYMSVIERKTAALFEAACELGAATGGTDSRRRAAAVTYGRNLGLAFQMVDDVLDLVGTTDVTGKEPGSDLREGVLTLPVILSAQRDPELAARLRDGERKLSEVLGAIVSGGGVAGTMEVARRHAEQAAAALSAVGDAPSAPALEALLEGVLAQAGPHLT
jgi:geranylgeranyl pyrophosphate synthase